MSTLSTELRNKLERTVIQARDVAEAGAKAALEALAVHHHEPYGHMSPEERKLRNHLRARARQLGDKQNRKGELEITHLVWECAYEHWHRMLFARFLAENDLLIEPSMGVAISLEECEELAKKEGKDLWSLASEFAQRMLPQIFRQNDPVLRVTFASEHRLSLEKLLNDLEPAIFTVSDSLGWVYQFWQSKRKKEVNQSGNKIGADELPAVTQLFTEPYMVSFLLDNSLGAWWAARRLTEADLQNAETENELRRKASLPGVPLEYLRFVKLDNGFWTPAAGTFEQWPEHLGELKTLDPCCGSGHFLVAAFLMLVPMRMELEGLSTLDACDAVLRQNLHGLEIDKRCVELAVFALALAAWVYPDAGGFRPLPELNVACSGLAISAKKEEWLALAGDNKNVRIALEELYKQFKDAPLLGSLINPNIGLAKGSLFELKWEEVGPLLAKALSVEKDDEKNEMGVVARGVVKAAKLLINKYELVITNVPYLSRIKQTEELKKFCDIHYAEAKNDLANVFLERCLSFNPTRCVTQLVMPQNWLFLAKYKKQRESLLRASKFNLLARLGPGAFETISGEVVNVILFTTTKEKRKPASSFSGFNVSNTRSVSEKANALRDYRLNIINQEQQTRNADSAIVLTENSIKGRIGDIADSYHGITTTDLPRFSRCVWENIRWSKDWILQQGTVGSSCLFGGKEAVLLWENGTGGIKQLRDAGATVVITGLDAWGRIGIVVNRMNLGVTLYLGDSFDTGVAVLVPRDKIHLPALWSFCSCPDFAKTIKTFNDSMVVEYVYLPKVPFDLDYWTKVAEGKYPHGLPKPYSDDPTQWIFHGYPAQNSKPLQVAVARLLGYRWPAELDGNMALSDEARACVNQSEALLPWADEDGIVCTQSIRGEEPAVTRLQELLAAAQRSDWSPAKEQELILATGTNASNLDDWLRDHFFEQHCKLFHHRPFIWHIWDGRRRDGFHALVNYHKLAEGNGKGRQLLESLTYSYLGDWITRQKEGVKLGEGGAEDRLAAALELQKRLIAIIEGEPPFDIFVRWKPIEEQPIGWEPDINDGVRLNIRPFMAQDIPGGRKGAGILRWKSNIKWNKDRGKDVASAPWFPLFKGDRINDIHLSINDKQKARKEKKQT